jgi:hypothetical protein
MSETYTISVGKIKNIYQTSVRKPHRRPHGRPRSIYVFSHRSVLFNDAISRSQYVASDDNFERIWKKAVAV